MSHLRLVAGRSDPAPVEGPGELIGEYVVSMGQLARLWLAAVDQDVVAIGLKGGDVTVTACSDGRVFARVDDDRMEITLLCDEFARRRADKLREWERDGLT